MRSVPVPLVSPSRLFDLCAGHRFPAPRDTDACADRVTRSAGRGQERGGIEGASDHRRPVADVPVTHALRGVLGAAESELAPSTDDPPEQEKLTTHQKENPTNERSTDAYGMRYGFPPWCAGPPLSRWEPERDRKGWAEPEDLPAGDDSVVLNAGE